MNAQLWDFSATVLKTILSANVKELESVKGPETSKNLEHLVYWNQKSSL